MPKHRERIKSLSRDTLPRRGSVEWERLRELVEVPGKEHLVDDAVKRMARQRYATLQSQADNGTGLPVDRELRTFVREFNQRLTYHGVESMPGSFNVLEAFVQFVRAYQLFAMRTQENFSISLSDFIDRVTDGTIEASLEDAVGSIPSGVIYNIENAEPPGAFVLAGGGSDFVISGASLVCHGTEVSILLLAGQKVDFATKRDPIAGNGKAAITPGREQIRPDPALARRVEPLENAPEYQKLIVLTRFDVAAKTQHVLHVMEDWGDGYTGFTNNPEIFPSTFDAIELFKRTSAKLKDYDALVECCRTLLLVPLYINHFGALAREQRIRTRYGEQVANLAYADVKKFAPPSERIAFRKVTTILSTMQEARAPHRAIVVAPDFQVESSGFWKMLSPLEWGEDRNGNPVAGKTWVTQHLSWVQRQKTSSAVVSKGGDVQFDGPDPGWIYVMRQPFHATNVFKVGLTRRDSQLRAKELSGTGSPEGFLVVNEWPTGNCVEVERRIHERLAAFRVNPAREFFAAPFDEIRRVVESVLAIFAEGESGKSPRSG